MADDNYADKVAKLLIDQLKAGTAPWTKPWEAGVRGTLPYNAVSGASYRGANSLYLHAVALTEGYDDNRWMTYKQAQGLGAQVRKGEHSTPIQFWQWTAQRPLVDEHGNVVRNNEGQPIQQTVKLDRPLVRGAAVFNAKQIDGLPPAEARPVPEPDERHARAQLMLDNSGANIRNINGDRAYYSVTTDTITMPFQEQFIGKTGAVALDAYFATALHELGHWSGHPTRLDRDLNHPFGSDEYAREELRAEIASLILGDELGIGHDPKDHASYVSSWIRVLENDPREIFRAATAAQRISSYIIDLENERNVQRQDEVAGLFALGEGVAINNIREDQESDMKSGDRVYLSVPYADRVEARQLGARWDKEAKAWWIGSNIDAAPFAKWQAGIVGLVGAANIDPIQAFADAIKSAGLRLDGSPVMDGTMQRVPVEGDKGHQLSGAYIGFLDGRPAGTIQNFKAGTKTNWKSDLDAPFDKAAAERISAEAAVKREEREAATAADQAAAARVAMNMLKSAQAATTHEYLTQKQVQPHGISVDDERRLLVPIADFDGQIMSFQTISENGSKSFLKGGKLVGGQHTIGENDPNKPLVIAEGYATAASIHDFSDLPVAVAFNAGNLLAVAQSARDKWPDREIIIAGDNDAHRTRMTYPDGRPMPNVGLVKAEEAAKAVGGLAVVPIDINCVGVDWNDVARSEGPQGAKKSWDLAVLNAQYDRAEQAEPEIASEQNRSSIDVVLKSETTVETTAETSPRSPVRITKQPANRQIRTDELEPESEMEI